MEKSENGRIGKLDNSPWNLEKVKKCKRKLLFFLMRMKWNRKLFSQSSSFEVHHRDFLSSFQTIIQIFLSLLGKNDRRDG